MNRYEAAFQQKPPYQAAALFTGASLLVHAMEQCKCKDSQKIAKRIRDSELTTVFGQVGFDSNNQVQQFPLILCLFFDHVPPSLTVFILVQNSGPFALVQFDEALNFGALLHSSVHANVLSVYHCASAECAWLCMLRVHHQCYRCQRVHPYCRNAGLCS
jgi:hypothetical protein